MNNAQLQKIPRATITKVLVDSQIECGVCLDTFNLNETEVRKLPCDHLFHSKCIFPWLKRKLSCPYCRATLPIDNEFDIPMANLGILILSMRADLLRLAARMTGGNDVINQRLHRLEQRIQLEQRTLDDSRSQVSSMSVNQNDDLSSMAASVNADHSQIEEPGIERRQRQTFEGGSSLTRRVRRAAAVRARSAIEDIYRR